MTLPNEVLEEELGKFFKSQIEQCQKLIQTYLDERIDITHEFFKDFCNEQYSKIRNETNDCLKILRNFAKSNKNQRQHSLFDPNAKDIVVKMQASREDALSKQDELQHTRLGLFEIAAEKLPEVCTADTIKKFKLSYPAEIKLAVRKKELKVYQRYGESKKAAFLLFQKEEVLRWTSKKWGL